MGGVQREVPPRLPGLDSARAARFPPLLEARRERERERERERNFTAASRAGDGACAPPCEAARGSAADGALSAPRDGRWRRIFSSNLPDFYPANSRGKSGQLTRDGRANWIRSARRALRGRFRTRLPRRRNRGRAVRPDPGHHSRSSGESRACTARKGCRCLQRRAAGVAPVSKQSKTKEPVGPRGTARSCEARCARPRLLAVFGGSLLAGQADLPAWFTCAHQSVCCGTVQVSRILRS